MATFFMFGRYSMGAVGKISAARTDATIAVIEELGGELKEAYALLGKEDLVFIVEFPGIKQAMKASVELAKLLGVSFTTAPAITVAEFDKLVGTG
ncbi:MAG: hypothetical protein AMJ93_14205 [Anaerolineae bacterium SM23_84]|nr:MAG: hypothetical protein AMJ93_14205 [Anaerolineae bacterium SM23_84]